MTMPDFCVSMKCVTIFDSYKVRKWNMRKVLRGIKEGSKDQTKVFERSLFSLKMEWICHNFLYFIGYERDRTRDTDLDNPCDRPEWEYVICGILVWIFVW